MLHGADNQISIQNQKDQRQRERFAVPVYTREARGEGGGEGVH